MMDLSYAETVVKRENGVMETVTKVAVISGIIIGLLMMALGGFFILIGAAVVVILGIIFPRLNVQYEYIYVDGQIDFDKIMGSTKRKHMLRLDFTQIDTMAVSRSKSLDQYNNIALKTKDFTSGNKDADVYVIIASKGNDKLRVLIEPGEDLLKCIKNKNRNKIIDY